MDQPIYLSLSEQSYLIFVQVESVTGTYVISPYVKILVDGEANGR